MYMTEKIPSNSNTFKILSYIIKLSETNIIQNVTR
jgi:hypothetical protein